MHSRSVLFGSLCEPPAQHVRHFPFEFCSWLSKEQLATSQTESQDRRHCERMMLKFVELGFKLKSKKLVRIHKIQTDTMMSFGGCDSFDNTSTSSHEDSHEGSEKTWTSAEVEDMRYPCNDEHGVFSFSPADFSSQ